MFVLTFAFIIFSIYTTILTGTRQPHTTDSKQQTTYHAYSRVDLGCSQAFGTPLDTADVAAAPNWEHDAAPHTCIPAHTPQRTHTRNHSTL